MSAAKTGVVQPAASLAMTEEGASAMAGRELRRDLRWGVEYGIWYGICCAVVCPVILLARGGQVIESRGVTNWHLRCF